MMNHREQACAAIFKMDFIYTFGGLDRNQPSLSFLGIVDKYIIAANEWESIKIKGGS